MQDENNPSVIKRGRGRPRKDSLAEPVHLSSNSFRKTWQRLATKKTLSLTVIFLLVLFPAYYFYDKNKDTEKRLNEIQNSKQTEADQLINQVGKHVLLPQNEKPTFTTVQLADLERIKAQRFFAEAQAGDKVIIYNQAKKAILFRPSIDKIIEMAPLNSESNTPAQ